MLPATLHTSVCAHTRTHACASACACACAPLWLQEGTPAAAAGLRTGDVLLKVSGEDLRGYTPDDAAALLRGPQNSRVSVVAKRGQSEVAPHAVCTCSMRSGTNVDPFVLHTVSYTRAHRCIVSEACAISHRC